MIQITFAVRRSLLVFSTLLKFNFSLEFKFVLNRDHSHFKQKRHLTQTLIHRVHVS